MGQKIFQVKEMLHHNLEWRELRDFVVIILNLELHLTQHYQQTLYINQ